MPPDNPHISLLCLYYQTNHTQPSLVFLALLIYEDRVLRCVLMTVQWSLGLCHNDGNGNEWPLRYPPYSTTINNSIYDEKGSYSSDTFTIKELFYFMIVKVVS